MWGRLPKRPVNGLIGIFSILFCLLPQPVSAVSSAGFTAYPSGKSTDSKPYFIYHLAAGQQQQDSLTVVNTTDQVQPVILYPVDAVLTNTNGFGLLAENSPRQDVGSWVQLPISSLTLAPHASKQLSFTVTVPTQTTIGPHYGGIIVQPTQVTTTQTTGSTSVTIVPRLGVRIYETVPGTVQASLSITKLDVSRHNSTIRVTSVLRNDGNTLLSPMGSLTLRNTLGVIIATQPIQGNEIFRPGGAMTIHTTFTVPPGLPQRYSIREKIQYGTKQLAVAHKTIWIKWQIFLLVSLLIFLVVGSMIYSYRRSKR